MIQLDERRRPAPARASAERRVPRSGGPEGNERLTASTAVLLLALFAIEGVTILFLRPLLSVHVFVGMLLIPPVALKLGSTGWRFLRYYAGAALYRVKGSPPLLLRLLVAPAVVLSTVLVFATGVALLLMGPAGGLVLGLHKASFVVWFFAMAVHVLAHLRRVPKLAAADLVPPRRRPGGRLRLGLLLLALAAGAVLAAGTLPLADPWLSWARAR